MLPLTVRLAALYSGGKDSTFSVFRARQAGHDIVCLLSMRPSSDESLLFHYPNTWLTDLLANAMHTPLASFQVDKASKDAEIQALNRAIILARTMYNIDGLEDGAI